MSDGIPTENCVPLFEDSKGFIWFGTSEGIIAYDGTSFTIFGPPEHFEGDALFGIEDNEGVLWFGGVVGLMRATRSPLFPLKLTFEPVLDSAGKRITSITDLHRDPSGEIMASTPDRLFEFRNGVAIPFTIKEETAVSGTIGNKNVRNLSGGGASSFTFDANGYLWFATGNTIFVSKIPRPERQSHEIAVRRFFTAGTSYPTDIINMACDLEGRIWFLVNDHGFFWVDTARQTHRFVAKDANLSGLTDFSIENGNELWIGCMNDLYRYTIDPRPSAVSPTTDMQVFSEKNGLPHGTGIFNFLLDRNSNLWFHEAYAGPARLDLNGFTFYPSKDFGIENFFSMFRSSNGTMFIQGGGVSTVRTPAHPSGGDIFQRITFNRLSAPRHFGGGTFQQWGPDTVLAQGDSGHSALIIQTNDGKSIYHELHYRNNSSMPLPLLSTGNPTMCGLRDRNGFLYLSEDSTGIAKFIVKHDTAILVKRYSPHTGPGFSSTRAMCQTKDGKLWFGGFLEGLSSVEGDKISNYTTADGLTDIAIRALHESRDGTLWIGTRRGGMCVYHRGKFFEYPAYAVLRSNTIWSIAEDDSGIIWLGTEEGLASFKPDPLFQKQPEIRHYDERDGISRERVISVVVDSEYLSCATNSGLYVVRRKVALRELGTSTVYLKSLRVNGIEEALRSRFDFAPSQNTITIGYGLVNQAAASASGYRYKLVGLMPDWSQPTPDNEITLADLRPGRYLIALEAVEAGSSRSPGPSIAYVQFSIAAPYWQTLWFYIFAACLALTGFFVLYRYRVGQLLKMERIRSEEREQVRKKVARDFHDEFGHRLAKISLFSEILKTRANAPDFTDYLEKIRDNAQSTYNGVRDFVWTLDPQNDRLSEIAVRLKKFGNELYDKTAISFKASPFSPDLENVHMTMDQRRHLILIFQEVMTNALKHACCELVTLEIERHPDHFTIVVRDNGKGFREELVLPGSGIRNMKTRALELAGDITVRPAEGGGTEVRFSGRIP
ncbi:MAG TPA: two-component regulator propeller domain-containing protein [Bacteroidota bacterium]|nr:two-component regulator propeller domain-containing protein [Bacteroidota bacterium]